MDSSRQPRLVAIGRGAHRRRCLSSWRERLLGLQLCTTGAGASRVAVSLYLGPLCGAVAAWAFLNEHLQGFYLMGALLILPGIVLATQRA